MTKYYLISYYARLKNGGFGFSRTYHEVKNTEEFSLIDFEAKIARETNLKENDIALISRIEVTVEEYNQNTNEAEEAIKQHKREQEEGEAKLLMNNGNLGDE